MTHVLPPLRASATRPRSRSGGRARAAATGIPRTMLTSSLSNFPPRPPLTTPCGVARGRGTRGHASFCPSSSTSSLRPRMRPGRGLALPGASRGDPHSHSIPGLHRRGHILAASNFTSGLLPPHPHVDSSPRQNESKSRRRFYSHILEIESLTVRHPPKSMKPRENSPNTMSTCSLEPISTRVLQSGPRHPRVALLWNRLLHRHLPIHSTKPLRSAISIWFSDTPEFACASPKHANSSCLRAPLCYTKSCEIHVVRLPDQNPKRCPRQMDALCHGRPPNASHNHLQHSRTRRLQPPSISFPHPAAVGSIIPRHLRLPAIPNALEIPAVQGRRALSPRTDNHNSPQGRRPIPPTPGVSRTPCPGASHPASKCSSCGVVALAHPPGRQPSPQATPCPSSILLPETTSCFPTPATSRLTQRRCIPPIAPTAMSRQRRPTRLSVVGSASRGRVIVLWSHILRLPDDLPSNANHVLCH